MRGKGDEKVMIGGGLKTIDNYHRYLPMELEKSRYMGAERRYVNESWL